MMKQSSYQQMRIGLGISLLNAVQDSNVSLIQNLLQHSADPNVILPVGVSPFHIAAGNRSPNAIEVVEMLLQFGGDPNKRCVEGMSAVHVAATWGCLETLKRLLNYGGDVYLKDEYGQNALEMASAQGHADVCQFIENEVHDYNEKDDTHNLCYSRRQLGSSEFIPQSYDHAQNCQINHQSYLKNAPFHGVNVSPSYVSKRSCIHDCHSPSCALRSPVHHAEFSPKTPNGRVCECSQKRQYFPSPFPFEKETNSGCFYASGDSSVNNTCIQDQHFSNNKKYDVCNSLQPGAGDACNSVCHLHQFSPTAVTTPTSSSQNEDVSLHISTQKDRLHKDKAIKAWVKSQDQVKRRYTLDIQQKLETFSPVKQIFDVTSPDHPQIYDRSILSLRGDNEKTICENFNHVHVTDRGAFESYSNNECSLAISREPSIGEIPSINESFDDIDKIPVKLPSSEKITNLNYDTPKSSDISSSDCTFVSCDSSYISLKELLNGVNKSCQINDSFNMSTVTEAMRSMHLDQETELPQRKEINICPRYSFVRNDESLITSDDLSPDCSHTKLSPSTVLDNSYIWTEDEDINVMNQNVSIASKTSSDIKSQVSQSSSGTVVEYLYTDDEGHEFIERHCLVSDSSVLEESDSTIIYDWRNWCKPSRGNETPATANVDKKASDNVSLGTLTISELRGKLVQYGASPGPITLQTQKSYMKKLAKLMKDPVAISQAVDGFQPELAYAVNCKFDMRGLENEEQIMIQQFQEVDPTRRWREGCQKSSFNYLLLDPRVTKNLPCRASNFTEVEQLKIFVASVFYVGKGKRSRPYAHFHEALSALKTQQQKPIPKVKQILDIWEANLGVVSLHCFQNVIPVEAYTREACMIEALGLGRLTNVKMGNYYGIVSSWPLERKRRMGVFLLQKAMKMLLLEGERQIRPADI